MICERDSARGGKGRVHDQLLSTNFIHRPGFLGAVEIT